ncbi:MAG: ATP-binding cassette domain-containing protein [Firmicutes bacterium]|nr:ATP-binding cassette domain-containing protein [Bacillota bacterium]
MSVIEVADLRKEFLVRTKEPGLLGSLKAAFRPQVKRVEAVKGISFQVEKGEMLAFIGPNGAGKSTTIKMLTGILFPTAGTATVLGFRPWDQREKLAFRIGSVFGQKSQLWYHLPPADTFNLLARIYELEERAYRYRRDQLVEFFEIQEFLHTPVRKLSLGQRMRCEVAASLLHRPQVVFLDEPTIGLDVVAKQQIRDIIRRMNREEQVTVFLTSHDAGDVEQLCKRVIIVNHGEIILDDLVSNLKRDYLRNKIIDLRLAEEPQGFEMDGVRVVKARGYGLKLEVDTDVMPIERVVTQILGCHQVRDITISDPPLEAVISRIYTERLSLTFASQRARS